MKLTKSKLRDLIPLPTRMEDGNIICSLDADDDYRYDIFIVFYLDEEVEVLKAMAWSKLTATGPQASDALLFCNKYNEDKAFLSVHYDDDDQDFNACWAMSTKGASDECISENLEIVLGCIWKFFVAAGKEF